jgi:hypothetical protein
METKEYSFIIGNSERIYKAYGKHPADAFEILKSHYGHRWTRSKTVLCITPEGQKLNLNYGDL